jgi:hypothetical protein
VSQRNKAKKEQQRIDLATRRISDAEWRATQAEMKAEAMRIERDQTRAVLSDLARQRAR